MKRNKFFYLEVPDLAKEAAEFVKQTVTAYNYPIPVGFSGGKDSVCLAKIMELSGVPYQLNYSFTGIDPPEVVRFIRQYYPDCVFWKPKETFWKRLRKKNPPTVTKRWCCDLLKKTPAERAEKGKTQRVLGIRAEESVKRKQLKRINDFKNKKTLHPLFYWNEAQVWEFIEHYDLSVPTLYDEGFHRIGCVVCPFHSPMIHKISKERWPQLYKIWEREVTALWKYRQEQGKDMYHSSPEEFLKHWYDWGNTFWYRNTTKRKRKGFLY